MHGTRNFAIAPDGAMFVEMGSHDNVSEYQPGAKIFQIKDGKLVDYASGIRNPVGIAFYPGTSDLFVAVNERDGLGDNLPPDYFTYVKPGGFLRLSLELYRPDARSGSGRQAARHGGQGDRARCAVSGAQRADRAGLLYRRQFSRRL